MGTSRAAPKDDLTEDFGDADEDKKVLLRRHNLKAIRDEAARRKANPVKWFEIEILLGNDQEAAKQFLGGMEEGDVLIQRGKKVIVSQNVINRLDDAVLGVAEPNPDDPSKVIVVDRRRFTYQVFGEVPNPHLARNRRQAAEAAAAGA